MKYFTFIKDKSTRVHDKNFQIIGDKPLYKHLLDKLPQKDTFVNTDSERVFGDFNIIKRKQIHMEECVNGVYNPVTEMTRDFLENYVTDDHEVIVSIHVTSPFLSMDTIQKAVNKFKDGDHDSILSVTKIHGFSYVETDNKLIPINFNPSEVKKTQDLNPIIILNNAFYIYTKESFLKNNNRIGKNPFMFELKFPETVDIDYPEDLEMARIVFDAKHSR